MTDFGSSYFPYAYVVFCDAVRAVSVYWSRSVVRPRASVTVVEAVPPFGGITVVRSPPKTALVRHCSSPYLTDSESVIRPVPSNRFRVAAGTLFTVVDSSFAEGSPAA
ncbi:hypothetical protein EES39_40780 [Streptomyces sp. ADI92-24]|uniref:hypothetical protein n=1 Tax=Streptomyces sp. NBC_01383 TaxID=2903846 RepID=UPI000F908DFF|nr:hypothetical protein EES39_40780 [Streptomyces sp. ADI92-24]